MDALLLLLEEVMRVSLGVCEGVVWEEAVRGPGAGAGCGAEVDVHGDAGAGAADGAPVHLIVVAVCGRGS